MYKLKSENNNINKKSIYGQGAIHYAAYNENSMRKLLGMKDIDINSTDKDCRTALHLAVIENKSEVVKVLLEKT